MGGGWVDKADGMTTANPVNVQRRSVRSEDKILIPPIQAKW
jgi:hypothetical protein